MNKAVNCNHFLLAMGSLIIANSTELDNFVHDLFLVCLRAFRQKNNCKKVEVNSERFADKIERTKN